MSSLTGWDLALWQIENVPSTNQLDIKQADSGWPALYRNSFNCRQMDFVPNKDAWNTSVCSCILWYQLVNGLICCLNAFTMQYMMNLNLEQTCVHFFPNSVEYRVMLSLQWLILLMDLYNFQIFWLKFFQVFPFTDVTHKSLVKRYSQVL